MSIVVYECDTCNRSIDRKQNPQGLDVIGRCIITDGCKGFLHKKDEKKQHNIPRIPPPVEGLTDWVQRKILHTHEQNIASLSWYIEHNLGTEPAVQVNIEVINEDNSISLQELLPTEINTIDENNIQLIFNQRVSGIAQCISRSSAKGQKITTLTPTIESIPPSASTQISANGLLTIGIAGYNNTDITVEFNFYSTITRSIIPKQVKFYSNLTNASLASTPWSSSAQILVNGVLYNLFTGIISDLMVDKRTYSVNVIIEDILTSPQFSNVLDKTIVVFADSPFGEVDGNMEKYIKLNSTNTITYRDNEMFYPTSMLYSAFPFIRVTR